MKWTVKNMLFLFLFVIAAILVAKWLGNRVPAIGKITNQIQEGQPWQSVQRNSLRHWRKGGLSCGRNGRKRRVDKYAKSKYWKFFLSGSNGSIIYFVV